MQYLLHGATNWNSTNFGDFLYAYEIYQYLKKDADTKVGFYDPSNYFIKYISKYASSPDHIEFRKADCVIYIPGGYFGEGHNARFRDTLVQYIRFMPFGLKAIRAKKKLLTIGIGAGPINRWFMKSAIKKICKNSIAVTTRDIESKKALQDIGINNVPEYSDMMLAYDLKSISKDTKQIQHIRSFAKDSKIILVHYNHSSEALEKFATVINSFVNEHQNYKVVVCADSILPYENDFFEKFNVLCGCEVFHFIYDDPFELLKLIEISDTILTCKLHVGVVGCMFDKAVVCAAEHPEKTIRFYDLIDRPQNCISLYDSTADQILKKLDRLYDIPLNIPTKEAEKAMKHWLTIQHALENNYEK